LQFKFITSNYSQLSVVFPSSAFQQTVAYFTEEQLGNI